ncbi:hypothetical protein [Bradyrhizobium erythrophlei]|uniref:Uncharacterized protein n=1 Tax=Bradyrhizobium erythrophlei TaxID=1437360 RepID=A0A1M5PTA3_9BRAD|nr:hypothetical protein [Bradyrhizobium erythrophlei]SHH04766.1 hypothetical protein SAMN05443248_3493 [Bradyrhizobium erythrophlei]
MKQRDLTNEEIEGLKAFAQHFGRTWKDKLALDYWMNARIWVDQQGREHPELHRLRNDLGPRWLAKFNLGTTNA